MAKISEIIHAMIKNDQQLEYYISNKLLNLTQFSIHIKPLVDTQMKCNVPVSTIVMSLSRIQKRSILKVKRISFQIKQIKLHSNLCTMSFSKSPVVHQKIQQLYNEAIKNNVYFTISESSSEITFITKSDFMLVQTVPKPKFKHLQLAGITIQFDPKYLTTPGIITTILQKLSLASINFVEIASTCTEITIYVNDFDLKLAFNTIHDSFFVAS